MKKLVFEGKNGDNLKKSFASCGTPSTSCACICKAHGEAEIKAKVALKKIYNHTA